MIRIGIDVGGTFTDFVALDADSGELHYYKVPSTPHDPSEAIAQGIEEMLALFAIAPERVGYFGHGTTVATNMVIERRGVPTGLITTKGFRDVLAIGRQIRPELYDYSTRKPDPLIERHRRLEVSQRMNARGEITRPLDEEEVARATLQLKASGVESIAICFLHSYRNPEHEQLAKRIIEKLAPELYVSISSDVLPEFREFERTSTTALNAYVGPRMRGYLDRLRTRIAATGIRAEPLTFHSNGGLLPARTMEKLPVLTCLSGPAAGVVGSAAIGTDVGIFDIITFDVGGTSTDVSLITGGQPRFTANRLVSGYPVKMPMIDIHVIGAGGGSIAAVDDAGALKVGPRSAGAVPGPIAYSRGGTLVTLTDANVVLGRLNPETLLDGRMKVDRAAAVAALDAQIAKPLGLSVEEAAYGILSIATANMSRAIRAVSTEHGHDPADFTLFAFGGAGPLHASEVARECGIRRVLIPGEPGTLCARGILLANVSRDFVRTYLAIATDVAWNVVGSMLAELKGKADGWLSSENVPAARREFRVSIDARYYGQSHDLRVDMDAAREHSYAAFAEKFHTCHQLEYGHNNPGLRIEIVTCRVQAVGVIPRGNVVARNTTRTGKNVPVGSREVFFGPPSGWQTTPVFRRSELSPGERIAGPAIIEEMSSTTIVLPDQHAGFDNAGNLILES